MKTVTIELTGNNSLKALKELEHKHLIRIIEKPDLYSYALPGEPMSEEDFKTWVKHSEEYASVSLTEAKQRWALKKKKLRQNIR